MLFSPSIRSASLAPRIGDDVLPTPAEEWAEKTVTSIKHSADFDSPPSRTSTPGPRVPGAYPFEGETDYSRGIAFHQGYLRTQKNVMDAVMGAGTTAKRYLPGTLASYLPSTTEKKLIIYANASQAEHENIQDACGHTSGIGRNSGPSNSSEAFLDHLSAEAATDSAPTLHKENEIDASHLTPRTNPDERRSSLLSDISTKTINGSLLSSPSRYSSQLSLTPRNEALRSSSETADTTYHGSEPGETKHDHEGGPSDADIDRGIAEHSDSQNEQAAVQRQPSSEDDTIHGTRSDTPIGSPYPAFLGPVDSGSDRPIAEVSDANGVVNASSSLFLKSGKIHDMEGAVEGFQGVQQPMVNTQARTHPLAGSDAKWNGIPLEEQYQKALDDNSDRQLNIGSGKGLILDANPAYEERKTQEVEQGVQGLKTHVSDTSNDSKGAPRLRTTSAVFDKPIENHQKSQRPASEGYTPEGMASSGARTKNAMSPTSGSSKASRASFMDKLKGEMKVISGKLSNNGAKVEEGRRLMGKIA